MSLTKLALGFGRSVAATGVVQRAAPNALVCKLRGMQTAADPEEVTVDQSPTKVTNCQISIENKPGSLSKCLHTLEKNGVNLSYIESVRTREGAKALSIFIDCEGLPEEPHLAAALQQLRQDCLFVNVLASQEVPWFPRKLSDMDVFAGRVLSYGAELDADHPGFKDEVYRQRRTEVVDNAFKFRTGDKIPRVNYIDTELDTWAACWNNLMELFPTHSCRQYQKVFPLLVENCGYGPRSIPQLEDISQFLQSRTGFRLRPVAGLLSPRDFLNGLAFRVFHSTQYIRHHENPLYTPEPDIIHELLGHVPLFADPDFADFSQEIGLASLGASDEDIQKLSTVYWFTVEFGLCRQDGRPKAFGAGLLSSSGELAYSLSDEPKVLPFDPKVTAVTEYPITTYQPTYFLAESFTDMKLKMREFADSLSRPFTINFNNISQTAEIDRFHV